MGWHQDRLANQQSSNRAPASLLTSEAVNICPTCGVSGDDPCKTPSGKVKDTPHAKRGN